MAPLFITFWKSQLSSWVHYFILYSIVKESTFLKGNYGIYKRFIDVFYILTSAWKKKQNMPHFEIDFMLNFAMFPADLTCVNASTIKLVLRKLLLRINLWVSE